MVIQLERTENSSEAVEISAQETQTCIKIENLCLFYDKVQALTDVSMDIPSNQITALIGPSGCGKSTFLRAINRMNELISGVRTFGNVYMDEEEIYSPNIDIALLRKKVGMVFQRPNPFPMSIYDNISYGPKIHGIRNPKKLDEIVETSLYRSALLDEVKDNLKKPAMDLSGGQQQRLCIARVLAVEPEVILLDEPCSALDPISTLRIEELMMQLKKDLTLIIVTHNMQQAARISDLTGFFLNGQLIEFGISKKVFTGPANKKTEDYITGRFG